ncbi:hypothetical protein INT48_007089 [Thamnidium elegans]|uniref:Geranylgeranyl transferase type-2 subunit alpha n=1 Tax=Thamnidium elegans TaxID=101142 RepID=A0A8H7VN13_9FUNG|nr:hypothetical protein INT48_007089 [Thamnidium elegans]
MSDVHGRKREKTTEEIVKARKLREAGKIKEYNQLVQDCRTKMKDKQYDADAFNLTTKILQSNPDYYTIWNYRRILILDQVSKDAEKEQKLYQNELVFFLQLIKINPKSYWLWNHRIWCLQTMPLPDWKAELGLVDKMLTMDALHGWDYRRFVVSHLVKKVQDETKIADIVKQEYEFTTRKINQSFSNYSAWHQRSKLLPDIVVFMSTEEKNKVAVNELDLVKAAIYTDPEDQSAWLYYWWLLGRAPEEVELLGAYQLKDTPLVILGFNDMIKFMQVPQLFDANNQPLLGKLYPLCEDSGNASIWLFLLDNNIAAKNIIFDAASTILPSSSSKKVPCKQWDMNITEMDKGEGVFKRVESLKNNLKNVWVPPSTKMYKDPALNDQTSWYTLDRIQLVKDEIETVRELLELEPDSAWALQTLAHFLNQLLLRTGQVDLYNEIIVTLDKLIEIDSDRKHRYQDQSK